MLDLTERKSAGTGPAEKANTRLVKSSIRCLAFCGRAGPDGEPTHVNQRVLDYSRHAI